MKGVVDKLSTASSRCALVVILVLDANECEVARVIVLVVRRVGSLPVLKSFKRDSYCCLHVKIVSSAGRG